MKKISKIISAMLVFAMLFQAPCAFASVKTKSKYTGITWQIITKVFQLQVRIIFGSIQERVKATVLKANMLI